MPDSTAAATNSAILGDKKNPLRIALLGTRGVPANYGGFETCVEELGQRLAARGHLVTVYCRTHCYTERRPKYLGMKLVYVRSLRMKALDTLSHTFLSILHALREPFDVYMVFNAANSPALVLPRLLGKKIAINTDGLEWKRGKWGRVGRAYYQAAEWLSTKIADRIVADSPGIQRYYRERYHTDSTLIAYGAYPQRSNRPELLEPYGLKPGEYFLQITRFEPENNPLLTVEAFGRLKTQKKLVLVGGVPYASEYSKRLFGAASKAGVLLPGYIYDKDLLNELWCNCHAYVHGNEVGGTNPALLQSMASGAFTIALDVEFNRDVMLDGGIYYNKSVDALSSQLQWALDHGDRLDDYRTRSRKRIVESYSWDSVADGYEAMFHDLCEGTA